MKTSKANNESHYEFYLNDLFKQLVPITDGIFVDVGGGTGQTLFKLGNIKQAYCFEPLATNEFIKEAESMGHTVFPVCLSDSTGIVTLRFKKDCQSVASIIQGFRPTEFYNESRQVIVVKGDDLFQDVQIGFLKIDAEGSELEVLKGLQKTIERDMPFILFEILPNFLAFDNQPLSDEIIRFRDSRIAEMNDLLRGYSLYRLSPKGKQPIERLEAPPGPRLENINHLAVPCNL